MLRSWGGFHGINIFKMKKKIFGLLLLASCLTAGAQVTINVQLPPSGLVQKDQLWNVVAVNNTSGTIEVIMTLSLQENATGRTVLSASSGKVVLPRGMKALTPSDVQPVQYSYVSTGTTSGYLPIGNYTACYRLNRVAGDAIEAIADECVQLRISPLSPPLLNTPADRSEIATLNPQFSWIPPTPSEMFSDLNYRINLAEVMPGQTPAQALLSNVPVYTAQHVSSVFESYPASYTRLAPGKQYAWQVQAYNGNDFVATTEVWTFKIKSDSTAPPVPSSEAYIQLPAPGEGGGVHEIEENELLVTCYSFDKAYDAPAQFIDDSGHPVQEWQQHIIYGDNYFRFRLGSSFRKGKLYNLVITDHRGALHKISFSIKK